MAPDNFDFFFRYKPYVHVTCSCSNLFPNMERDTYYNIQKKLENRSSSFYGRFSVCIYVCVCVCVFVYESFTKTKQDKKNVAAKLLDGYAKLMTWSHTDWQWKN